VDLVISYLVMPCMSGYTLPADDLTGAPYLRKPFTSPKLLAKMKGVITANLGIDE